MLEEEVGYLSPADFDEPETTDAGVNPKDENDMTTLQAVLYYLERQIYKLKTIDSLDITQKLFPIDAQLKINQDVADKLDIARAHIKQTIEGIEDKYDERSR